VTGFSLLDLAFAFTIGLATAGVIRVVLDGRADRREWKVWERHDREFDERVRAVGDGCDHDGECSETGDPRRCTRAAEFWRAI
jgi:hypothetical protein